MSQPKLGQIIEMLEKGENFELTNQQYKKKMLEKVAHLPEPVEVDF